jgi:hypothetical protein
MNNIKIRLDRDHYYGLGFSLRLFSVDQAKQKAYAVKDLELDEIEDGFLMPPIASIQPQEVQQLMDELWVAGLRPSEGVASTGQLEAMNAHVNDMRTIAFKLLNIRGSNKGR